ncbi:hypothetical protein [uncultured Caulobacter sp.]|jgi:hypothetical protein|uniref:hypothetical protein n=1 Tax=uncultured Caulobacter sp. TaxID=158749 RepID=UPI002601A61A|nr:hypothetical protein [uncultured Caulobacter sp.]
MEAAKSPRHVALTILLGAAVAGTLDITEACVYWGVTKGVAPERVFQGVASGLLGKAAFTGGAGAAALGLAAHYVIMTGMVACYVLASLRLPILIKRPVTMGLAYGAATFVAMKYGVVPLSNANHGGPFVLATFVNNLSAHLFVVGLPIALIAAWRARQA